MSYQGLTACAIGLAMSAMHIGRMIERRKWQKRSDAVRRIDEKYRAARTR